MATPLTGHPDKTHTGIAKLQTLQPLDPYRFALDVLAHVGVRPIASDATESGTTTSVIVATGHSAEVGDTIRFTSGAYNGLEVVVVATETNNFTIGQILPVAPGVGDGFDIRRSTRLLTQADGTLEVNASVTIGALGLGSATHTRPSVSDNTSTSVLAANSSRLENSKLVNNTDTTWWASQDGTAAVLNQGERIRPGVSLPIISTDEIFVIQNSGGPLNLDVIEVA